MAHATPGIRMNIIVIMDIRSEPGAALIGKTLAGSCATRL